MPYKEARCRASLTVRGAAAQIKQIQPKMDAPLYSKIETGIVYPTPELHKFICKLYNIDPRTVATRTDPAFGVRMTVSPSNVKKAAKRKRNPRLSFAILPSERPAIDAAREICGYPTVQSWLDACKNDLLDRAEKKRGGCE